MTNKTEKRLFFFYIVKKTYDNGILLIMVLFGFSVGGNFFCNRIDISELNTVKY